MVVGSGAHYVPLVYIENVVDALMLAAQRELPNGAVYQLVDPEGIRQKDYVDCVRRSGRPVHVSYVPAWLLKCAAAGAVAWSKLRRRTPSFTPYRVSSIPPLWPCDCTAAHTQLGWTPRVSIQEGLGITFPSK